MTGLVAVTGATGFLGRNLVPALADAGWRIRVLARRPPAQPIWPGLEVETVLGDVADDDVLAALSRGADLVIHAAGLIKARGRRAFAAVNVDGTRRMAEAAQGPMLLVSSQAAREPGLSDYAASKRAGEDAARRVLGARLTIVRPPALYGPGDPETLPLFKAAATSPVLPLFAPAARIALMHVEDTARQIAALAERRPGGCVTLCDERPEGYGWREIMETAAATFGRTPRLARTPDLALKLAAGLALAANLTPLAPMLTPGKAREILHRDWSVTPAEQLAGLPPPRFDIAEGFRHTVEGYRAAGVVFGK
jgi:nucleoside-diphosphate-sugar epimerase